MGGTNTSTKNIKWKNTDKRFVAFLDILGFKELVMRNSHNKIYELLTLLSEPVKLLSNMPLDERFKQELGGEVELFIVRFSDSVIIFSKNDSLINFEYFVGAITSLFSSAIQYGIPLKGALAYGEISVNREEQIYFGQPIIDAHLLQEDVNYLGVVADCSIDEFYAKNSDQIEKKWMVNLLLEKDTPLKSCGLVRHLNIDWTKMIAPFDANEETVTALLTKKMQDLKLKVSGSPRRYIDNTLKFFAK